MAHQHGATREEVAETLARAIYMGGGPAAAYGRMRYERTISFRAQGLSVGERNEAHHIDDGSESARGRRLRSALN